MGNQPHVLVIPCPAQGHVMPLMKLSLHLVDRGFMVTFVNTDFIQARIMATLPEKENELGQIRLVSIPDGLGPEERNDHFKLHDAISNVMPGQFEKLIRKINESSDNEKIACVIADETIGWALEIAGNMGIRRAAFFPAAASLKALTLNIPKLIEAGTIDDNGTPKKNETIMLSPTMPAMNTAHFAWHCVGDLSAQQTIFRDIVKNNKISKFADWLLCNSFYELETAAYALVPNLLPIGPLLASSEVGHFWPEDSTCLTWLNQQATGSVIYVAFGSVAIFNQLQFDELALGLELLGMPFLWVVRSGLTGESITTFPDGFQERVAHYGKLVGWAPQQKVLAHPSIACFLSHCGWNSTMEGVSMGVPFICWPYFADQFFNKSYITDVWKVGLGLNMDENGIISRDEIKRKVEELLGDEAFRERALELKEMARKSVSEGGSSFKNFEEFIEGMKC